MDAVITEAITADIPAKIVFNKIAFSAEKAGEFFS